MQSVNGAKYLIILFLIIYLITLFILFYFGAASIPVFAISRVSLASIYASL